MEYKIKCADRNICVTDGKICTGYCYFNGHGEGTYYPDFKDSSEKKTCGFSEHITKRFREESKTLEGLR